LGKVSEVVGAVLELSAHTFHGLGQLGDSDCLCEVRPGPVHDGRGGKGYAGGSGQGKVGQGGVGLQVRGGHRGVPPAMGYGEGVVVVVDQDVGAVQEYLN